MSNRYLNAMKAVTDSHPLTDEQRALLISAAYELDSQYERLVRDAASLAASFTECAARIAADRRGAIRADLAAELAGEQGKYETAVLYVRRTVRLVLGSEPAKAFEAALTA